VLFVGISSGYVMLNRRLTNEGVTRPWIFFIHSEKYFKNILHFLKDDKEKAGPSSLLLHKFFIVKF